MVASTDCPRGHEGIGGVTGFGAGAGVGAGAGGVGIGLFAADDTAAVVAEAPFVECRLPPSDASLTKKRGWKGSFMRYLMLELELASSEVSLSSGCESSGVVQVVRRLKRWWYTPIPQPFT